MNYSHAPSNELPPPPIRTHSVRAHPVLAWMCLDILGYSVGMHITTTDIPAQLSMYFSS